MAVIVSRGLVVGLCRLGIVIWLCELGRVATMMRAESTPLATLLGRVEFVAFDGGGHVEEVAEGIRAGAVGPHFWLSC